MRSNIKDVARRAGVSIATVSHVVNNTRYVSEEKRRKVLNAIEGLNYKPNATARSLRSPKAGSAATLVCSAYSQKNPRLLHRLLHNLTEFALEQRWTMTVLYAQPVELLRICREQSEYDRMFVITDNAESYAPMLEDSSDIYFFDMGLYSLLSAGQNLPSAVRPQVFHASHHFYTELSNFISDQSDERSCFLLSLEQSQILRDLFLHNINYRDIFQSIKVISSEISAAYVELMELLDQEDYDHIYLLDYKFALGAVKLLLLKPHLIHSQVSVSYFSYDTPFENFGLPVRELPFVLSKSLVEEITGSLLEA